MKSKFDIKKHLEAFLAALEQATLSVVRGDNYSAHTKTAGVLGREIISEVERLQTTWISADERKPDECETVFISNGQKVAEYPCLYNSKEKRFESKLTCATHSIDSVTHWMPIPEAPEHPLQKKMDEFFKTVKPEELVKDFENLGYEFEPLKDHNLSDVDINHLTAPKTYYIEEVKGEKIAIICETQSEWYRVRDLVCYSWREGECGATIPLRLVMCDCNIFSTFNYCRSNGYTIINSNQIT